MNFSLKSLFKCTFIFVLFFTTLHFAYGQSSSVPINGVIDKPDTKFALYELFYANIDAQDIDPNEAELTDQFLVVKNHNAKLSKGKLIIDGEKVFTTDPNLLPFLSSVNILDNGIIWPSEIEYYQDNFENITTVEESYERVNNANNTTIGTECIRFVLNDPNGEFTQGYINVLEEFVSDMASLFCCPGSNPVTFIIQPSTSIQLGGASPQFLGNLVDSSNDCNAISQIPFMTGLLGESQDEVAIILINPTVNWYFGGGDIGVDEFDLYTVLLHEFMHGIGLASTILPNGNALGGGFSPWDQFLEINGQPLLDRLEAQDCADCCYEFKINENLILPDDIITASQNGQITISGLPVCTKGVLTPSAANADPALFYNMLSHIDEDCDFSTETDFVLNSNLDLGEIRDEILEDELLLLQTLGYCTNTQDATPSCYVSLVDDFVAVLEGDPVGVELNVLENDVLPTNFTISEDNIDLTCGDVSGISVSIENGGLRIFGLSPGNFCFNYSLESSDTSCGEFCDIAEVCVFVRPIALENDCEPEDCSLYCLGDFEDFVPQFNGYYLGINQTAPVNIEEPGGIFNSNSPDVLNYDGNNILVLRHFDDCFSCGNEFITIPLSSPISPNCELLFSFDANCLENVNLNLYGSEFDICPQINIFTPGISAQDVCNNGNNFYQLPNTYININPPEISCLTQSPYSFDGAIPLNTYEMSWVNNSGVDINFITISLLDTPGASGADFFYLDNIMVTSSCDSEITVIDSTPPENLVVCSNSTVTIEYEICLIGEGLETTDVTLKSNFNNALIGSVSINPISSINSEPTVLEIPLNANPCPTISLVVDLNPDVLLIGQEIEIIMEFESEDVCNQQDGQISTIVEIEGVSPTSEFGVLVECLNVPPTVSFTAFETNNSTTSYLWDFGDGNMSTESNPTHIYDQSGTYTVMLQVTNGCGSTTSSEEINFDCDSNPIDCPCSAENSIVLDDSNITTYSLLQLINNNVLTPGGFAGCLNIDGTLLVDTDYVFDNATLVMQSGSAIEIQPNIQLEIQNQSMLMGCDALWTGILVNGSALLSITDSYISDAFQAIHLLDGSTLSCQDNDFVGNYIGIFIPPHPNAGVNAISFPLPIIGNTFKGEGDLLPNEGGMYTLLFDDNSYTGIFANHISMGIGNTGLSFEANNTFENMYNGIRFFDSFIRTSKSTFTNIVSNDNDIETGHAVYTERSSIISFLNKFLNTEFGVRGSQSELKSFQDVFDNFRVGVEMVSTPPLGFVEVFDGEFSIYTERAIVVFNSPETNINCSSNFIKNDLIFDGTFQEGISIFDSGSKNESLVLLEHNVLVLGENQAGITLANTLRAELNTNSVSFVDSPTFDDGWSRGFKMSNCAFTKLDDNSVFGASLPSSGFETEDSPNQIFNCNSTSRSQLGIKFMGINCDNTELNTSELSDTQDAGVLLSNTRIGGQEHTGNTWCDGFVATFIGDPLLVSSSRFDVDTLDQKPIMLNEPICLLLPEPNVGGWFFANSGETLSCIEDRPQNFINISESDIFAASQDFSGEYSETTNWIAGRYLLNKIDENIDMLGQNIEVDAFYQSNSNTLLNAFNILGSEIIEFSKIDESIGIEFKNLQTEMEELRIWIDNLNIAIVQAISESERELLIAEKSNYELMMNQKLYHFNQIKNQARSNVLQNAQDLKSLNQSITTPNLAAENEKSINAILLNSTTNPLILDQLNIRNKILAIANQCPASGGLSVYRARSLYDMIMPGNQNEYSEIDDCYSATAERTSDIQKNTEFSETENIHIFPNPTSGILNVLLENPLNNGHILVKDLIGKEVAVYKLEVGERQLSIDLNVIPGVYFISVTDGDKSLKNTKIVVQ